MTIPFKELRDRWMQDPAFRAEYDRIGPAMEAAFALAEARARAGLSQSEVARRMGTTQSTVARLETGRQMPSLRSLERYAEATGHRVAITLEPVEGRATRRAPSATRRRTAIEAG